MLNPLSRSLLSQALLIAIYFVSFSGCESESPVGVSGKSVEYSPSQETISFQKVQNFTPGTEMKLQINRSGTVISTVNVVFKGTYTNGDERLIIAEAPEDVIIGAGDSGSPLVESGGKVAGILCYGYYGNNRLFLARAIDDVLAVGADEKASGAAKKAFTGTLPAVPLGCSYVLTGNTSAFGRNMKMPNRMRSILPQMSISAGKRAEPAGFGKKTATETTPRPIPGRSIFIDEVVGDVVNFYAVGTISYTRRNEILAFGHGYWVRDNSHVSKPVGLASMKHMIETTNYSFKLAERTENHIGSFIRDDHDAVLITRDSIASTIGLTMNIKVHHRNAVRYSHRISYDQDKDFEKYLLRLASVSSMDKSLNNHYYRGDGKGEIRITVAGKQFDTTVVCTSQTADSDSTAYEASVSRNDEGLTAALTDKIVEFVYSKAEEPFTLREVTVSATLKPDTLPGYNLYDSF